MGSFLLSFLAPCSSILLLSLLTFTGCAIAILQNTTIDDQYGDLRTGDHAAVTYRPPGVWIYGPSCSGCKAKLDSQETIKSSWHDSISSTPEDNRNITISFTGSAIYLYCIVPNYIPDISTIVNLTFILDGLPAGSFFHSPGPNADIAYNVSVYANSSLSLARHEIVLRPTAGTAASLLLFDYAVYSFDDGTDQTITINAATTHTDTSSSTTSSATSASLNPNHPKGKLPVAAAAGIAILALGILALLFLIRWLRHRHHLKLSNKSKDLRSGFIAPFHAADHSAPTKMLSVLSRPQLQSSVPANDSTVNVDVPLPPYETEERPSTPTAVYRPAGREDPRFKE